MIEQKLKHLEFIQNVITRMNTNSFLIKGWTITLVSALFVIATNDANVDYIYVAYMTIVTFWLMDSVFLVRERQYRKLYDEVIKKNEDKINFNMHIENLTKCKALWISSIFSITLLLCYGVIIASTLLVIVLIQR